MDPATSINDLPEEKTIWNRNFIGSVITNLFLCLGHFSVNTHVATYATFLGAVPVVMGLLTGMFFGISLMLKPVAGPAMTKIDKRLLMILVFFVGGISNLGYALFHDIGMFIFFRVLNGIQYGFVGCLTMTIASDALPKDKMASGMGLYGIGGAIGAASGPSISHWLFELGAKMQNDDLGYTFIFLFAAVVFFLALIPCFALHPDKKTKEQVASTGAWYKNIVTIHALPTTIVMFFIIAGYAIYNSYVFNLGDELNIGNVSLFYTFMAGTMIVSRPLSGWLCDRYGVSTVVIPGMILFAASFIVVGFSGTIEGMLVGAVLAALGIGGTQPAIQAMCMKSVEPLKRSVAGNTMYIAMDSGFFVGPILGSIVYKYTSYAFMFKVAVVPVLIAFVCFLFILPMYKRRLRVLEEDERK